jgi:UDP-N-acetylmuramate dehydrogenase
MEVLHNLPLKPFNTFGIDVNAREFVTVRSIDEILEFLSIRSLSKESFFILGGGSNVLFTRDYDGTVLKMGLTGIEVVSQDKEHLLVKVMAGKNWDEFVIWCVNHGWGGMENLSGIPGLAGASPIQNIGAYGAEMKDHFVALEALEISTGVIREFDADSCEFGYRDSIFKKQFRGQFIILSVTFRLDKKPKINLSYKALREKLEPWLADGITIAQVRKAVLDIRGRKLPDPAVLGNAGSFFKNPVISQATLERLKEKFPGIVYFEHYEQVSSVRPNGTALSPGGDIEQSVNGGGPVKPGLPGRHRNGTYKLAAGWLIDQCGWKGFREGEAGVHKDQALVLVNYGNATGREILDLARRIQLSVLENFGIELETEVNVVN